MKKIFAFLSVILVFSMLLMACDSGENPAESNNSDSEPAVNGESGTQGTQAGVSAEDKNQMFTERDSKTEYDKSASVAINLSDNTISCSSKSVTVKGTTAVINGEGTYVISGKLNDGMIIVNAGELDKVQIVLDNATINSATCAPIYVAAADKVFVTLADNSENTLSNGGAFTPIDSNNIDAAIYSTQDITFNGNGKLTVDSPAGHGIFTKDDLVFASGSYTVTSLLRGVDANDSVRIKDASISITSGKDGVRSQNADDTTKGFIYMKNGTLKVTAKGDGISAGSYLQIDEGSVKVKTESEDETVSSKALKSDTNIAINGGKLTLEATDDAINANQNISITAGTLSIKTKDDAISATKLLKISGGTLDITECYEGLDSTKIEISGGKINIVSTNDAIAVSLKDTTATAEDNVLKIEGGELLLKTSGDGIDVKGSFVMLSGKVELYAPRLSSSDIISCEGSAAILGGTFVGFGWNKPTLTFDSKNMAIISATLEGSENSAFTVKDSSGKEIVSLTAKASYGEAFVCCADLVKGATYSVNETNATAQ